MSWCVDVCRRVSSCVVRLGAVLGCSYAVWPLRRPSWGPLAAALGLSWGPLGPSWRLLGPSWRPPGPSWAVLGRSWGALVGLLGRLGPDWEASWAVLGSGKPEKATMQKSLQNTMENHRFVFLETILRVLLGRSWAVLGASCTALGASLGHLGARLGRLGAVVEAQVPSWGNFGGCLGCREAI